MWNLKFVADPLCPSAGKNNISNEALQHSATEEYKWRESIELNSKSGKLPEKNSVLIEASADIEYIFKDTPSSEKRSDNSHSNNNDSTEKVSEFQVFLEGKREARVVLADLFALALSNVTPKALTRFTPNLSCNDNGTNSDKTDNYVYRSTHVVETLHSIKESMLYNNDIGGRSNNSFNSQHDFSKLRRRNINRGNNPNSKRKKAVFPPYILERTDAWCDDNRIYIVLRVVTEHHMIRSDALEQQHMAGCNEDEKKSEHLKNDTTTSTTTLQQFIQQLLTTLSNEIKPTILSNVANSVLQNRIRALLPSMNAVSFIANGSILPRKSGASAAPMSSPPAIPFQAPNGSPMNQEMVVDMGNLKSFLVNKNIQHTIGSATSDHKIRIYGMVIPTGVTLIVGGGYHGKSTLLRTIAAGVYNKVLGDGRELCVTVQSAVSVRAEDGRYVNNCNVSAFISNLPTVPTKISSQAINDDTTTNNITGNKEDDKNGVNTAKFSTKEASGSTSQASNVSEAIEMGASAMLVDEDVSAANFMARDGRMRALVMDESITPLLYRVNGLYNKHRISSVVVVGGVGDWLDVPDAVVKLDRYVASDALAKARSISAQFSYGHVQYAGRGVVHRLVWDPEGTPLQRRPDSLCGYLKGRLGDYFENSFVSLLEGGGKLSVVGGGDNSRNDDVGNDEMYMDEDEDDHIGVIDMSRCEQLLGGNPQLYGCGLCVAWILRASSDNPKLGLRQLLDKLEEFMDQSGGIAQMMFQYSFHSSLSSCFAQYCSSNNALLLNSVGFAYRPRRYEVAMALTRMRGLIFEDIPMDDNDDEAEAAREAEQRKRELADLWANRRKGKK